MSPCWQKNQAAADPPTDGCSLTYHVQAHVPTTTSPTSRPTSSMRVAGHWPGLLTLRQGWAKAEARPWNLDTPDAHLRLIRGSSDFISACGEYLLDIGVSGVCSPPLPEVSSGLWLSAGYQPYLTLDLYSRDLAGTLPEPSDQVIPGRTHDWTEIVAIDRASFSELWRLDEAGLQEALGATPHSSLLLSRDGDRTTGFAIVGVGSIAGYLQRVAVHPDHTRQGIGRSLVRAAYKWARRRGALSMMLNTQTDNEPAARLYVSEGFEKMLDQLTVLRLTRP